MSQVYLDSFGGFGLKLIDFEVHPSNVRLGFLVPFSLSLFHVYSYFLLFEHVSLDYIQLKYCVFILILCLVVILINALVGRFSISC